MCAVSPLGLRIYKLHWAEKQVFIWVWVRSTLTIGVREQQEQKCCKRKAEAGAEGSPSRDLPTRTLIWPPEPGSLPAVPDPVSKEPGPFRKSSLGWKDPEPGLKAGLWCSSKQLQSAVGLLRRQGCRQACQWHSLNRGWRPWAGLACSSWAHGRGPGWGWSGPVKFTSAFKPWQMAPNSDLAFPLVFYQLWCQQSVLKQIRKTQTHKQYWFLHANVRFRSICLDL